MTDSAERKKAPWTEKGKVMTDKDLKEILTDGTGYDPFEVIAKGKDEKGWSYPQSFRQHPQVADAINKIVNDKDLRMYSTASEFYRDAVIHRLLTLQILYPELMEAYKEDIKILKIVMKVQSHDRDIANLKKNIKDVTEYLDHASDSQDIETLRLAIQMSQDFVSNIPERQGRELNAEIGKAEKLLIELLNLS